MQQTKHRCEHCGKLKTLKNLKTTIMVEEADHMYMVMDAIHDIATKTSQHYNPRAPVHHDLEDKNCCLKEIKDLLLDYEILHKHDEVHQ